MRIAVTYEDGNIFQHFGHTEYFKLYDVENGSVVVATTIHTDGSGHGALVDILKKHNVDALICGGIGAGAKHALAKACIKLYGGAFGNADQAINSLLTGSLNYNSDLECNHHAEHHGGDCADHNCDCSH